MYGGSIETLYIKALHEALYKALYTEALYTEALYTEALHGSTYDGSGYDGSTTEALYKSFMQSFV